jgi:hypothetical protein
LGGRVSHEVLLVEVKRVATQRSAAHAREMNGWRRLRSRKNRNRQATRHEHAFNTSQKQAGLARIE